MLFKLSIVLLFSLGSDSAVLNVTCPEIDPKELDLKGLDGKWYIAAVATDLQIEGSCATMVFSHKSDNSTDVSISWMSNNTISFYNGSVALAEDARNNVTGDVMMVTYIDKKSQTYSLLDLEYEHFAVIFACSNNDDGNSSTYELWKINRTPHLKDDAVAKMEYALSKYNLQNVTLMTFNNTEETCKVNGGGLLHPSVLLTSAAAIGLFRRLF